MNIAYQYMLEELKQHQFQTFIKKGNERYPKWANNPIEHPIPTLDKGFTWIDVTTDISGASKDT